MMMQKDQISELTCKNVHSLPTYLLIAMEEEEWTQEFTFHHSEDDITRETCAIDGSAAAAAAALAELRPVGPLRAAAATL